MDRQKRQDSPQKQDGHGADSAPDTSESDTERTCGACGRPIRGRATFTRWGPVHPNCRRRVPNS